MEDVSFLYRKTSQYKLLKTISIVEYIGDGVGSISYKCNTRVSRENG